MAVPRESKHWWANVDDRQNFWARLFTHNVARFLSVNNLVFIQQNELVLINNLLDCYFFFLALGRIRCTFQSSEEYLRFVPICTETSLSL